MTFDHEYRGQVESYVEFCSICLLGPQNIGEFLAFYNCNHGCISVEKNSKPKLYSCLECLQLSYCSQDICLPEPEFYLVSLLEIYCVRLKLTVNFSSLCFQKLFKNGLDIKNCNYQRLQILFLLLFFMTRITFLFLIRQDDFCHQPVRKPRRKSNCKNIDFY